MPAHCQGLLHGLEAHFLHVSVLCISSQAGMVLALHFEGRACVMVCWAETHLKRILLLGLGSVRKCYVGR